VSPYPPLPRLTTGIRGLDPILEGGFPKGGVYIVEGPPGAGKTIFGNQICFHHGATGGQAVYVTLLAESHTRMLEHLRQMRFFRPELVSEHVYYLSAFKVLESDGLGGLIASLRESVTGRKATLLVVDGLVSAAESALTARDFRKFVHELQSITAMTGCTAFLLSSAERGRPIRPEHTMVDGLVQLSDELDELRSMRHLQIRKLRGANQIRGQHTLEISDEGIVIHPRIETRAGGGEGGQTTRSGEPKDFAITELDRMLHGGLPANSATMVLGPSGSGKTLLGLQFLAAGARKGEPVLYFGFYERPRALLAKSERIGLGLKAAEEKGLLRLMWQRPVEGIIDILGERVLRAVREHNVRRLCIDSMQGFQLALDFPDRFRDVFSAIAQELEAQGVTTLYTVESADLFGPRIEVPMGGVSAMTDNLILLRHVEMNAHLYRLVSVLKVRDSDYEGAIREFRISDSGIAVADTFSSADQVLSGVARTLGRRHGPGDSASKGRPRAGKKPRRRQR
jgi:circadian clock protein KaiC